METKTTEGLLLHEYWDLVYRAFSGISFSPEKRANSTIKDYSEELESDLKELGENTGNYKKKYIAHFTAWMNAKSRCLSTMIAGPSNFPMKRAEKANNSEHNRGVEFMRWRERYFKAVNRVKIPSPEEDLDNQLKKLDNLIINNEKIKGINKIVSSGNRKKLTNNEILENLKKSELISESLLAVFARPDTWYGGKIYPMQTLGVKIKKARERVMVLKSRIERKNTFTDIEFEGGSILIEDDRVKIFHEYKPDKEIISKLKSNGFRWSPNWKCWCRKHTGFALAAAKKICEVK